MLRSTCGPERHEATDDREKLYKPGCRHLYLSTNTMVSRTVTEYTVGNFKEINCIPDGDIFFFTSVNKQAGKMLSGTETYRSNVQNGYK